MTDRLERYSVTVNRHLHTELLVAPHESQSDVAVIKHRLPPGKLGGPLHRHANEDEISHILQGTMCLRKGDSETLYHTGDQVVKQRETWHTYWNPGPESFVFLEILAPGEFAGFFKELAEVQPDDGSPTDEQLERIIEINEKYELEAKPESVPSLIKEHDLDEA